MASHLNVEIKARCVNLYAVREYLETHSAEIRGRDHQVDTYFCSPKGRLKLREGDLENALIFYQREDRAGPKVSDVSLWEPSQFPIKEVLTKVLGVLVVVDKQREIYFIDNAKFHLDAVKGLGTFVEIEAIDYDGTIGLDRLHQQCTHFLDELGIQKEDLLAVSYSDMLLAKAKQG